MNKRHGGPYDRGCADSWYRRPYNPHFFKGATYDSDEVKMADMTAQEIAEYTKGYNENEAADNHKD